ncbi:MAG: metallophosphoesterase [Bacteroidales bacterium]|nr:metallophosphoesterase [Bacteroidales bacterium]
MSRTKNIAGKTGIIFLAFVIFLALLSAFQQKKPGSRETAPDAYSFFVAGHSYGDVMATNTHLHPPFKKQWPFIQSYPDISFGVLVGDIVRESTTENWDVVDEDLAELNLPVYFAPGNHDVFTGDLFAMRYGDSLHDNRTYRYFRKQQDLLVFLDSELDEWNISGHQLDFLRRTIKENAKSSRNVFVFVHSLIWWDDKNVFKQVHTNWWPPNIPDTTNYWTDVEPLLQQLSNPVYLFAGDLGANKQATPYLYYKDGNITYIASGMGNGKNDNFLFVRVDSEGDVSFDLIALQGDRHRLGKLEDYILP